MTRPNVCRVGVVGDYDGRPSHVATSHALARAAEQLGIDAQVQWLATAQLTGGRAGQIEAWDAILAAPGTPYRDLEGALGAIEGARTRGVPFLGTCGGFQYAALEYARHVLGVTAAEHAELFPDSACAVIGPLSSKRAGEVREIRIEPNSKLARIYGTLRASEHFRCGFGLRGKLWNPAALGALCFVAHDDEGEVVAAELADHPFYILTLYQPQCTSAADRAHPLFTALLRQASQPRYLAD